ncbi:MAG TPA: hypothetical protein VEK85_03205 [Gemmatimonadales bacterium]|nr:hypothetical protein [Gemmatimonadales bacterium]
MKWSWKLGTVAGIGLYVHGTFLLLLGWVGLSHWIAGGSAAAALAGVGFVLALFACAGRSSATAARRAARSWEPSFHLTRNLRAARAAAAWLFTVRE